MGTTAEKLVKLQETKLAIRAAIEGKGQTVLDTDPFSSYAGKIGDIKTGIEINGPIQRAKANSAISAGDVVNVVGNTGNIIPESTVEISNIVFSPDGKLAVVSDENLENTIYEINGLSWKKRGHITIKDGSDLLYEIPSDGAARFSPDGAHFLLTSQYSYYVFICNVNGTSIVDSGAIIYQNAEFEASNNPQWDGEPRTCNYSPDGSLAVIGGSFTEKAILFAVNGATLTRIGAIPADADGTALDGDVYASAFTPDGKYLILAGAFTGKAKVYEVNGTGVTYLNDIKNNTAGTPITWTVYDIAVSPDGTLCVLNKRTTSNATLSCYSLQSGIATFARNINYGAGTGIAKKIDSMGFSTDGKVFVIAGSGTAYKKAAYFTVNGTTFSTLNTIYEKGIEPFDSSVRTAAFAPGVLALGGNFSEYSRYYIVSDGKVTPDYEFTAIDGNETAAQIGEDTIISVAVEDMAEGTYGTAAIAAKVSTETVTAEYKAKEAEIAGAATKLDTLNGDTVGTTLPEKADAAIASKNSVKDGLTAIGLTPTTKFAEYGSMVAGLHRVENISGAKAIPVTAQSAIAKNNVCRIADGNGKQEMNYVADPFFSPDGKTLVLSCSSNATAIVLGVRGETNRILQSVPGSSTSGGAISPDGTFVVFNGDTKVYRLESGLLVDTGTTLPKVYRNAIFQTNTAFVANVGYTTGISRLVWDGSQFQESAIYQDSTYGEILRAISPSGGLMITTKIDRYQDVSVRAYQISDTAQALLSNIPFSDTTPEWPKGVINQPNNIFFSPDGEYLYLFGAFGGKVYSVSGGAITYIKDLAGVAGGSYAAYSGTHLATVITESSQVHLRLYSLLGQTLTLLEDSIITGVRNEQSLSFSPDRKGLVVICDYPRTVFFYSVTDTGLTLWKDYAEPVVDNQFEVPADKFISIGVATDSIESGADGTVTFMAHIVDESM